jgi:L-glyceraldehyde 3-phosphate reductase
MGFSLVDHPIMPSHQTPSHEPQSEAHTQRAHSAAPDRYQNPDLYVRCGKSGLRLPRLSLGLWHNFGDSSDAASRRALVMRAFDLGITHFDLANNYGPPPGAAEVNFGRILREEFAAHRDELVVSTKAGYPMWDGPYGDGGSRKHLLSSLDQSLRRLQLDYVDIFYHHRPDPNTPLEESLDALAHAVRSGKALYAGISNYDARETAAAARILRDLNTPCLIHQARYHIFDRSAERTGLFDAIVREGLGGIVFCPLAQGLLSDRYINGFPPDARAVKDPRFLRPELITETKLRHVHRLNALARARGQSLAQMALAWVLRQPAVTSALIGASKVSQIEENLHALENPQFGADELEQIEKTPSSTENEP